MQVLNILFFYCCFAIVKLIMTVIYLASVNVYHQSINQSINRETHHNIELKELSLLNYGLHFVVLLRNWHMQMTNCNLGKAKWIKTRRTDCLHICKLSYSTRFLYSKFYACVL